MLFKSQLTRPEEWLKGFSPAWLMLDFPAPRPWRRGGGQPSAGPSPQESPNCGTRSPASPSAPGPLREQMAPESADFSALAEHSSGPALTHPHFLLSRAHPSRVLPLQTHLQPWAGMENTLA